MSSNLVTKTLREKNYIFKLTYLKGDSWYNRRRVYKNKLKNKSQQKEKIKVNKRRKIKFRQQQKYKLSNKNIYCISTKIEKNK